MDLQDDVTAAWDQPAHAIGKSPWTHAGKPTAERSIGFKSRSAKTPVARSRIGLIDPPTHPLGIDKEAGVMNRLRRPRMKINRRDQAIFTQLAGNHKVPSKVGTADRNRKRFLHLQDQIRLAQWPTLGTPHRCGKVGRITGRLASPDPSVQE